MTRAEVCGLAHCILRLQNSLAPLPFITHHSSMIRCEGWCHFTHLRSSPPPQRLSLCPRACLHLNKVASELIGLPFCNGAILHHCREIYHNTTNNHPTTGPTKHPLFLPGRWLIWPTQLHRQERMEMNGNCLIDAFVINCLGVSDVHFFLVNENAIHKYTMTWIHLFNDEHVVQFWINLKKFGA